MIHNIPIKKFLAIALLFAAAYFAGCFIAEAVNGGQTESASASADGNWGLSFQEEGKPPVANATFDELKQYDAYYAENTEEKVIYLTFDCGYENGNTATILDALKKHNAPATFFVVGSRVPSYQAEIKRMHNNGHEIGNHTYEHKYLNKLNAAQIRSQIDRCNQTVAAVTGEVPALVRLPGGNKNNTVLANINQPIIMWNIDTLDWKTRNAASSVQKVLGSVKDGDIVLMHELYTASGDAAVTLIPALTERGYQLVTVSELARFRGGLSNKGVYYSFPK